MNEPELDELDELDELIRRTHPKPDFDRSFLRETWARIAVAEAGRRKGAMAWIEAALGYLSRPAPAFATAAVMILLGAGLGRGHSDPDDAVVSRETYLASINPLSPRGGTIPE